MMTKEVWTTSGKSHVHCIHSGNISGSTRCGLVIIQLARELSFRGLN